MKGYTYLWLTLTAVLFYENYALNHLPTSSLSALLFPGVNLSPAAGRPISLYLGWTGLGLILMTNLYIIRKRLSLLKKLGKMSGWLDFHIFCGLMGPTLIIFHTNFKVGGLVAISFWSMMIVAVSGVIGRYFYLQVLKTRAEFEKEAEQSETVLLAFQKQNALRFSSQTIETLKVSSLQFVGAGALLQRPVDEIGFLSTFFRSLVGDLRIQISSPSNLSALSPHVRATLLRYGLARRHTIFYSHFQKYLGYWHSFHMPFAFFMYFIAIIHVISALLFGVKG